MSSQNWAGLALAVSMLFALPPLSSAGAVSDEEKLLGAAKDGPAAKLGPWLANLYEEYTQSSKKGDFKTRNPVLKVHGGKVGIDAYASDPNGLRSSLAALGATDIRATGPLVSAQVPVSALGKLAALDSLSFASPVLATTRAVSQGAVVSQGDRALRADLARAGEGVDGTGIKVGALSDSFQCNPAAFVPGAPTSTAAQDLANSELSSAVTVISNGACPGADEGRAMLQLVHDVAPGAQLMFHTAFTSLTDFAAGILRLKAAGANVIVDDVIYFAENMFSDGIIAQAADESVAGGAAFFSSAGNNARTSYESEYRGMDRFTNAGNNLNQNTGPLGTRRHDFDPGAGQDDLQKIHVTQAGGLAVILFSFQWDQPFISSTTYARLKANQSASLAKGATGDLDLLIYNDKGILVPRCPPGVSRGITCQLTGTRNIGRDAVDIAALVFAGPKPEGDFFVSMLFAGGEEPQHVKYVAFDLQGTIDILEHDTRSGTAYGHTNARDAEAVGASSFYLTPAFDTDPEKLLAVPAGSCTPGACLNDFSSAGGVPIFLDKFGDPQSVEIRSKPGVTGVDGGNTTFFIADSSFDDDDGDGCNSPTSVFLTPCLDNPADEKPNFFGTSASAPHVAGVAALMLQKNGALTPSTVYGILRSTAHDMTQRVLVLNNVNVAPTTFEGIGSGFDFDSGFGFVDAQAALAATPP